MDEDLPGQKFVRILLCAWCECIFYSRLETGVLPPPRTQLGDMLEDFLSCFQ